MKEPFSRRDTLRLGVAGLAFAAVPGRASTSPAQPDEPAGPPVRPFLTPGDDFRDVSRGNPIPHTLEGQALVQARLTPETWRLEVAAEGKAAVERPIRIEDGTALNFPGLLALGKTRRRQIPQGHAVQQHRPAIGSGVMGGRAAAQRPPRDG